MADISAIKLPNGTTYNLKDTTARNAANSAVPNTRTVNGKALSSNISLGAGDVGAYTKSETDTKINAAVASTYKYKGSVTADKLPTSGQVVGDVYNITNDSSYGKAGMNVAWNGTTWDALGSNVDLSNYVTTSDSRLSNARPASDVYAWAKAAKKPSYSASEIGAAPASHTHTKDQVGLGNVANLDQSKAIKSITRNGTTFTATALDGTTSTFTQQDTNTTYGLASQSSNGLMSAADKKAIDREFFRLLPKGGTYIPANADLNSTEYIKVGNYYNSNVRESSTIKNLPPIIYDQAFIMYVISPLSEVYDNENTSQWVYRLRIFINFTGRYIFIQKVSSGSTIGSFTYGPWVKMTNSNDLDAVSKIIAQEISDRSKLIKADENNNTVIETSNKLIESSQGREITAINGETHRGDQFRILTNKAMQYSKPISEPNFSEFFGYVPMFDVDGVGYNLLTYTENTKKLDTLLDFYYANVLHYGADPTGVNDSTAAIQTALRSGKKYVVIPPGTYICNWARIPSDVSVYGYGAHLVATTGNTIFTNDADGITGGWVANSNITIEGIDFSAPNPGSCTPIGMGHCTNITIRNCTFHDIKVWHFVEFNSCKSCTIDNCYFYNYGTAGGGFSEMVQLDYAYNSDVFPWFGPYDSTPTQDTKIVNCSFIGNPDILSGRIPAAIGNHTGGNRVIIGTEISNCYFENLGSALKFVTCHNINFNNNYVKECNAGVYMGGNVSFIQINNNILIGRSNWINDMACRGIFIEYQNESSMMEIIGNSVSSFGGHGVTLQGTFVNCFNNHITNNGMIGLYAGWADFGSKYSDNICWGNNQLNEEGIPRYDFCFELTRANLPTTNPIGDALISNNKFSTCYIGISDDIENAQKSYFVMNFIKGTLVKADNALIVYGNNWNSWEPVDIGTVYRNEVTNSVQLNAKAWTPLVSLTVPVAGLYMIQGCFVTHAWGKQQGTIRIGGGNYRNSYDYEITEETARWVYCPLAFVKLCSANEVLTLEIWDCNGILADEGSLIIATRIG